MDLLKLKAALDETERIAQAALDYIEGDYTWQSMVHLVWKGCGLDVEQLLDQVEQQNPEATLRMVAAHRKILDLHASYDAADDGDLICQTCLEGSHLYEESAYPCPTLKLLAEGYGIDA